MYERNELFRRRVLRHWQFWSPRVGGALGRNQLVDQRPPALGSQSLLRDVSCTSATSCFAVGYYATTSNVDTLAARWNGTTWSTVAIPNPAGTDNQLSAVSCTSATSCFAVGSSHVSPPATRHGGAGTDELVDRSQPHQSTAVSCPAFRYESDELFLPSATTPPATCRRWSVNTERHELVHRSQPKPQPSTDSRLSGVSCTSATSCFAVGGSFPSERNAGRARTTSAGRSSPARTDNNRAGPTASCRRVVQKRDELLRRR